MDHANSIWPSEPIIVAQDVRALITRFFDISDSPDPGSGVLFAEEIFTPDGLFKTHETCVAQGKEAIAASRQRNSPLVTFRSHELKHVFANNSPATDLVVLGNFTIGLKDDSKTTFDFTARFIVEISKPDNGPRFRFVRVWTDPTEMKAAFEKAAATNKESA